MNKTIFVIIWLVLLVGSIGMISMSNKNPEKKEDLISFGTFLLMMWIFVNVGGMYYWRNN